MNLNNNNKIVVIIIIIIIIIMKKVARSLAGSIVTCRGDHRPIGSGTRGRGNGGGYGWSRFDHVRTTKRRQQQCKFNVIFNMVYYFYTHTYTYTHTHIKVYINRPYKARDVYVCVCRHMIRVSNDDGRWQARAVVVA
jgi:hypothetical protein